MSKKLISIIIPAYNEEDCIDELCRRLRNVADSEIAYDFEIFIIENGSVDRTWEKLQEVAELDLRV